MGAVVAALAAAGGEAAGLGRWQRWQQQGWRQHRLWLLLRRQWQQQWWGGGGGGGQREQQQKR